MKVKYKITHADINRESASVKSVASLFSFTRFTVRIKSFASCFFSFPANVPGNKTQKDAQGTASRYWEENRVHSSNPH